MWARGTYCIQEVPRGFSLLMSLLELVPIEVVIAVLIIGTARVGERVWVLGRRMFRWLEHRRNRHITLNPARPILSEPSSPSTLISTPHTPSRSHRARRQNRVRSRAGRRTEPEVFSTPELSENRMDEPWGMWCVVRRMWRIGS